MSSAKWKPHETFASRMGRTDGEEGVVEEQATKV